MSRRNHHLCNAYQNIPRDEVIAYLEKLDKHFMDFWDFCNYPKDKDALYNASYIDLVDVILHMDKRAAYYLCFHGCKSISERKRVALIAYYIIKFKPFRVAEKAPLKHSEAAHINEDFAIYIICMTLFGIANFDSAAFTHNKRPGGKTLNQMMRESFRHRRHTRNGMILLVESLTLESFKNSYHG